VVQPLGDQGPGTRSIGAGLLREVAAATAAARTTGRSCRCGHGKQAHEHHRRGTDCGLCTCARFSRPLLFRLGLSGG
jgi:hypothetical protein